MTEDPQKQYEDNDNEDTTGGEAILSPRTWTIILWSVILCLIVGGTVATFFGVREVLEANASKDWPTTQGKIMGLRDLVWVRHQNGAGRSWGRSSCSLPAIQ